jgi:hypothetical protein
MTVTNQNYIHEESKNRINYGKACDLAVQKILRVFGSSMLR